MNKSNTYSVRLAILLAVIFEVVLYAVLYSIWKYITTDNPNFRFEYQTVFFGLFALPVHLLLFILIQQWKTRTIKRSGDHQVLQKVLDAGSAGIAFFKFIIQQLAIVFLLIALSNPQYGHSKKTTTAQGIDIMIALDVSNSMLAEDMAGGMERLRIAKMAIEKLIYQLQGDRIGIVVFAGNAYKQLPITTDYEMAMMYLSGVNTGMLSNQGTAIGRAIDSCYTSFNLKENTNKTIIVISDGEDHEENAIEAARRAYTQHIIVNTIGIGSSDGAPIPMFVNGKRNGVKRDENGNPIVSKMNPDLMQQIATAGGGTFTHGTDVNLGLEAILHRITKMEKQKFSADYLVDFEDHFQLFLLIGLLLVMIDQLILNHKNIIPAKWIYGDLS